MNGCIRPAYADGCHEVMYRHPSGWSHPRTLISAKTKRCRPQNGRQWKTNQGPRGQGERASVEAVPLYSSGSSWACTFLVRLVPRHRGFDGLDVSLQDG